MGRKNLALLFLLFVLLVPATVFGESVATIPRTECRIGDVWLGMPYEELVRMHGEPAWKSGERAKGVVMYGKNLRIGLEDGKVAYIYTRANNGWRTPAGLKVGMSRKDAVLLYGEGNRSGTSPVYRDYLYWVSEKPKLFSGDSPGGYLVIASTAEDPGKVAYIELTHGGYWFETFQKSHYE